MEYKNFRKLKRKSEIYEFSPPFPPVFSADSGGIFLITVRASFYIVFAKIYIFGAKIYIVRANFYIAKWNNNKNFRKLFSCRIPTKNGGDSESRPFLFRYFIVVDKIKIVFNPIFSLKNKTQL